MRTPRDAVEGAFGAGGGHQQRVAVGPRVGSLRVSVLARESDDEFLVQAEPHRRELLAHCYRMTGSLHDAEDLVQETYLRAWKAYSGLQGPVVACGRGCTGSRPTPASRRWRAGSDGRCPPAWARPSADPTDELVERHEVPWLEPLPDGDDDPSDPSAIVGGRESVRLAFIAALQHLSPRQRAVLVLRDVLQWKAAEVADAIGTSTAAVNSLLQRARAQLDAVGPSADDRVGSSRIRPRRRTGWPATSRRSRTTTSTAW